MRNDNSYLKPTHENDDNQNPTPLLSQNHHLPVRVHAAERRPVRHHLSLYISSATAHTLHSLQFLNQIQVIRHVYERAAAPTLAPAHKKNVQRTSPEGQGEQGISRLIIATINHTQLPAKGIIQPNSATVMNILYCDTSLVASRYHSP
jgi:hypothetical protein